MNKSNEPQDHWIMAGL